MSLTAWRRDQRLDGVRHGAGLAAAEARLDQGGGAVGAAERAAVRGGDRGGAEVVDQAVVGTERHRGRRKLHAEVAAGGPQRGLQSAAAHHLVRAAVFERVLAAEGRVDAAQDDGHLRPAGLEPADGLDGAGIPVGHGAADEGDGRPLERAELRIEPVVGHAVALPAPGHGGEGGGLRRGLPAVVAAAVGVAARAAGEGAVSSAPTVRSRQSTMSHVEPGGLAAPWRC